MRAPILAVTGLKREADLLASPSLIVIPGGGDSEGLARKLEAAFLAHRPRGVISVGLGGALSPELTVGDWVVGDVVVEETVHHSSDSLWARSLLASLSPAHPHEGGDPDSLTTEGGLELDPRLRGDERKEGSGKNKRAPRVHLGPIAASDVMVVDAAAKAALRASTGAIAVDMESHVAARFAANHGLPFAVLRVISDGADRALPKAAQAGMKKDGGMDILAVLKSLALDPRQLPALIRTGREAEVAFRRLGLLRRYHLVGGPGIGDADLRHLLVDLL